MTGIIIGGVVLFIIILLVRQNSIDEKKKREEEQRRAEQKRLADIQAKKLADQKKAEVERLKKIEDEKYETVFVVSTSISSDGKHQAYFKRNNNTYISVTSTSALTANSNVKQLKENTAKWNWMSAVEFERIKQREEQQRQNQLRQQEQLNEQRQQQLFLEFCERNTEYCNQLSNAIRLDNTEPFAIYPNIQKISRDHQVWDELGNGVNILSTPQQLSQYIFSYGKMHRAKLNQAFETCISATHFTPNGQGINIIDYGCGQGLGTVALIDYLHTRTNFHCTFGKITLIEPSTIALKRAALHVNTSLETLGRTPINTFQQIFPLTKTMSSITETDLATSEGSVKFHIFSNILDISDFDLQSLCRKIASTQKGINYFVCVSPNFYSDGSHFRNQRLRDFLSFFNVNPISHRITNIGTWTRYEIVFKVEFRNTTRNNNLNLRMPVNNNFDDDLPF